jgi:hypothetical protein
MLTKILGLLLMMPQLLILFGGIGYVICLIIKKIFDLSCPWFLFYAFFAALLYQTGLYLLFK